MAKSTCIPCGAVNYYRPPPAGSPLEAHECASCAGMLRPWRREDNARTALFTWAALKPATPPPPPATPSPAAVVRDPTPSLFDPFVSPRHGGQRVT